MIRNYLNRLIKYSGFCTILIIFNFQLIAQEKNVYFQRFTMEEGLSQNSVKSIITDHRGFVWFGTHNGLNRFDGYEFMHFKRKDNQPGISNNTVKSLCEDDFGNLWIGTEKGLNVFFPETRKFYCYKHKPKNDNTIASDTIMKIRKSKSGRLIVAYMNSVDIIEILGKNGKIKSIEHLNTSNKSGILPGSKIFDVLEDENGNIWIATNKRLIKYITATNRCVYFENNSNDEESISNNDVHALYEDEIQYLWIGTVKGLNRYNPFTNKFKRYLNTNNDCSGLINNSVFSIAMDANNDLIIGTIGGISIFNRKTGKCKNYSHQPGNIKSISSDFINTIHATKGGNVWIGTENSGVNYYNTNLINFEVYKNDLYNKNSLSSNTVSAIVEDENDLWIATMGGGINKYNKISGRYTNLSVCKTNTDGISCNYITNMYKSSQGDLWIGMWNCGINVIKSEKIIHYTHKDDNPKTVSADLITAIAEDSYGNIWIGTVSGLSKYSYDTKEFENCTLQIDGIDCIEFDNYGNLWFGGMHGLYKINAEPGVDISPFNFKHKRFVTDTANEQSINGNGIITLYNDGNNLWIGTYNNGLNVTTPVNNLNEEEKFKHYTTDDGLCSNIIFGIIQDNNKNIWVSTDYGLSKLNPETGAINSYFGTDGLPSNQFERSALHKNKEGKLYFGSTSGLVSFHPDSIQLNINHPKVFITELELHEKTIEPGQVIDNNTILNKDISFTDTLVLSYNHSHVTFRFSSLNSPNRQRNNFAYILEGFDKDWRYAGSKREATYTNITSGSFVFRVRTYNNQKEWTSAGTSLIIFVQPPWWEMLWFRLLFVIIFIASITTIYLIRVNILKSHKKVLEQKVNEQTEYLSEAKTRLEKRQEEILQQKEEITTQADELNKKNIELNRLIATKDKFFSIIAHDLRNPFNNILNFSDLLYNNYYKYDDAKRKQFLEFIYLSSKRLYQLLENLLQWSRTQQAGSITVNPEFCDIGTLFRETLQLLELQAIEKNNRVEVNVPENIRVYADRNMITTVIRNLISNAMKFTNEGTITISVTQNQENVYATIKDTGTGMSQEKVRSLFKISNAKSTEGTNGEYGTGLGLLVCKEFVERNEGKIIVNSIEGEGSEFSFSLPATEKK